MDFSEAKEEVKKAADIVEIIAQHVQLKKRGQNHIGLCPFHSEKSPSFTVNQDKQIYHCFGCGRGGDVFTFWMEYHNLTFPQSLKDLAERYNIDLPQYRNGPAEREKSELKDQLLKINDLATDYFHTMLAKNADGGPGRDYFSRRHISRETISAFRLGYAAKKWDGLANHLRSKGISLDRGAKAGLLVPKKNGGYYDRFRDRVIFPIFDLNHKAIGFGGRVLDDSLPKYVNTPETLLYHKGDSLYGLDSAFRDIREIGLAIIVEGYMDVLVLRQHGISNVIATLGTALTRDQIRRLKGYAKAVVVLFDSDDAGREAALRSFPLFLNGGISAKVLVLPQGEDPDSFVNRHGSDHFKRLLEAATPIFDFYLAQALAHMDTGVDGQIKVLNEVLPVFMDIEQAATRSLYVQRLSEKTNIKEAVVWEELSRRKDKRPETRDTSQLKNSLSSGQDPKKYGSDMQFLNLLVHYPERIDTFRDQEWELLVSDPEIIRIIRVLMEESPSAAHVGRIEEFLDSPAARERLRATIVSRAFYAQELVSQAVDEFAQKIARVKISQSIRKAKAEGDIEMLNCLIKAKQGLSLTGKGN